MTELDKFKRRIIRSVARLLFHEKKPPDEIWKLMKKETGTDCRILWDRMRALCVKKLNRMIAADDRSANLPSIARLSLTDWLLVDLVLVHERIDVIAMEKPDSKEPPALIELFNLVQRFDVEGRKGDSLATCWAAATVYYNRQGRQCSPMLLQRRWYQLKKLTRCRFYKFWFSYKGNYRLLPEARKTMPSRLQMAIAKRYPKVITGEFPTWEQQIQDRLIVMPEEFEAKMRSPNLPKPCNSNDPDLVVVEPVIETIDLRVDSDSEDHNDEPMDYTSDPELSNDATDLHSPVIEEHSIYSSQVPTDSVETEPMEEDGLSNVQLISATHVPEIELPDESPDEGTEANNDSEPVDSKDGIITEDCKMNNSPEDEAIPDTHVADVDVEMATEEIPSSEAVGQNVSEVVGESKVDNSPADDEDDVIAIPDKPVVNVDLDMPGTSKPDSPDDSTATEMPAKDVDSSDLITLNDSDEAVDDIIKIKADEFCSKSTEETPTENPIASSIDKLIKDKADSFLKTSNEDISLCDLKPDVSKIDLKNNKEVTAVDLMADLNFIDDGIEFIDDGVEFVEESEELMPEPTSLYGESNEDAEGTGKFDMKLLMDPVVYTTKLDQMKIFTNKQFYSVDVKQDIEMAIIESKPVSKKTFKLDIKQESVASIEDTEDHDDNDVSDADEEDSEMIPMVSQTSYLLNKPKTRTYDPIKLCKNPDFNTKLRRLTIGFLSSTRNRQLLNACIPMTIDLSKAFESKLVDGTLYLKPSGNTLDVVKKEVIDKHATSMVPSAMPIQSLIDSSKVDIQNLISNQSTLDVDPIIAERKKVINLPDIDKVRKINQQLLTAQVPPLRVQASNSEQPSTLADISIEIKKERDPAPVIHTEFTEPTSTQKNYTEPATDSVPVLQSTVTSKVKVEPEDTEQKDAKITPPETLPPAKQKFLQMIHQAKISTQEALAKIDSTQIEFPKPIVINKVKNSMSQDIPYKKYAQPRVPVSWAPRYAQPPKNHFDDFLLTNDTLNKMLHLMMSGDKTSKDCKCCTVKPKVQKKKAKPDETQLPSLPVKGNDKSNPQKDPAPAKDPSSAPITIDVDSLPESNKPVLAPGRVVKYCCWAKQKLTNRRRITQHTCLPDKCECCCRDELAAKPDGRRKKAENKTANEIEKTKLLSEEKNMRNAIESIENVVQQSRDISKDGLGSENTPAVVKVATTAPFIDLDSTPVPSESSRKVQVEVDLSPRKMQMTPPRAPSIITKIVSPESASSFISKNKPVPRLNQLRHEPRPVQPSQGPRTACSCQRPAVSQDSQRNIVIDASRNCVLHPKPIAPKPEKVLYLHSKSISKSPSDNPIFLGKNKILLTTVKFPRQNEVIVRNEIVQTPKIIPTLPLPAGVQLVLMPSGDVTYTLDPGVELDEAQLATLPTIIEAVKQQLNSQGVRTVAPINDGEALAAGIAVQPVVDVSPSQTNIVENTELSQTDDSHINDAAGQQTGNNIVTEALEVPPLINLKSNEVFQDVELPSKINNTVAMEVDTVENTNISASAEQETITNTPEQTTSSTEDAVTSVAVDPEVLKENTALSEEISIPAQTPSVGESEIVQSGAQNESSEGTQVENPAIANDEPCPNSHPDQISANIIIGSNNKPGGDSGEVQTDVQNENLVGLQTKEIDASANTNVPNDNEGINNRKSLLSDLMMMSGISAEDATAPEPPVPQQPVANIMVTPDQSTNLPELSPVTSFAELKYACEQNGKFFKLDFETGVIVPINVCIKKNIKEKVPLKPKEFIDLTDDIDSTEQEKPKAISPAASNSLLKSAINQYLYQGKTLSVSSTVKPVKLFKALRPLPTMLKKPMRVETFDTPLGLKQSHIEKRKQNLNKIDVNINLVDSDEPMEEEYLDSLDDDSEIEELFAPMFVDALDPDLGDSGDSDSSDDEPLAKKSKRLKDDVVKEKDVRETNIYDEIPGATSPVSDPSEIVSVLSVRKDLGGSIDLPVQVESDKTKTSPSKMSDPVPSMDGMDEGSDVQSELRFMSVSDGEEPEEDCILGV